jgi:hypothetical protein
MARRWGARSGGILRWLLPALVLHAALTLLAAAVAPRAQPAAVLDTPALRASEPEWSVELTLLDDVGALGVASRSTPAPGSPFEGASRERDEARASGIAVATSRPSLSHATPQPPTRQPPTQQPTASLDIAGRATPAPSSSAEPASAPAADALPSEASPTLSLDQLGVGTNPFLDLGIQPLTKEEQANARLHAALHPPSVERERQMPGAAGPVAAAARRLVLDDDTLLETSVVLDVRVDGAGRVTEVHVLDASSQAKAWQMIAARLAKALGPVKLREGSPQGWGMKLRLASSVQLPSGAAPGMRFGVLHQQVAGSGGPGSTSLELSPTSKFDLPEPIDSVGRHMDDPIRVEVMLLKLKADPADIGAVARRVVQVAVLSIDAPTAP